MRLTVLGAVSYTHLDVYKRQIFKGEGRQGIQGIRRLIQFNGSDNHRFFHSFML